MARPTVVVLLACVLPANLDAITPWLLKVSTVIVPMAESAAMSCASRLPMALVAGVPPVFWLTVSCDPEAGVRLVEPRNQSCPVLILPAKVEPLL